MATNGTQRRGTPMPMPMQNRLERPNRRSERSRAEQQPSVYSTGRTPIAPHRTASVRRRTERALLFLFSSFLMLFCCFASCRLPDGRGICWWPLLFSPFLSSNWSHARCTPATATATQQQCPSPAHAIRYGTIRFHVLNSAVLHVYTILTRWLDEAYRDTCTVLMRAQEFRISNPTNAGCEMCFRFTAQYHSLIFSKFGWHSPNRVPEFCRGQRVKNYFCVVVRNDRQIERPFTVCGESSFIFFFFHLIFCKVQLALCWEQLDFQCARAICLIKGLRLEYYR